MSRIRLLLGHMRGGRERMSSRVLISSRKLWMRIFFSRILLLMLVHLLLMLSPIRPPVLGLPHLILRPLGLPLPQSEILRRGILPPVGLQLGTFQLVVLDLVAHCLVTLPPLPLLLARSAHQLMISRTPSHHILHDRIHQRSLILQARLRAILTGKQVSSIPYAKTRR